MADHTNNKHKLKGLSRKHQKSGYDFGKLCSLWSVLLIMAIIAIVFAVVIKKN